MKLFTSLQITYVFPLYYLYLNLYMVMVEDIYITFFYPKVFLCDSSYILEAENH